MCTGNKISYLEVKLIGVSLFIHQIDCDFKVLLVLSS